MSTFFINGSEDTDLSSFEDDELLTAVVISLFTDGKSFPDDGVEAPRRRGWWGDTFDDVRIGSRLWLLTRSTLSESVAERAKEYAEESLRWLVDDGHVRAVRVMTELEQPDRLLLKVELSTPARDRSIELLWRS